MISALPDPVYSRDFDRPRIREEIMSDREKKRYSQQQSPIVAIGDGLWKPEYERRMKAEGEKRNEESWLRLSMWLEFEKMKGVEHVDYGASIRRWPDSGACAKPPNAQGPF